MKAVIQVVKEASVTIDNKVYSKIKKGLLVLVGVEDMDVEEDINWLSNKVTNMRIFTDDFDIMNLSVKDVDGEILIISQFTLQASTKKGNRPSYINASKPKIAIPKYEQFVAQVETDLGKQIATGVFGADMTVTLINEGPTTIVIDSKAKN
ncbi:D-aminoacyl-tRNA deacylase [Flavicella sp.]|uniref:D-aminoacyl-tRNA deacylase n=1 Tax=Flavicella sp. TaxID=2957742 RepID=UPI00301612AB